MLMQKRILRPYVACVPWLFTKLCKWGLPRKSIARPFRNVDDDKQHNKVSMCMMWYISSKANHVCVLTNDNFKDHYFFNYISTCECSIFLDMDRSSLGSDHQLIIIFVYFLCLKFTDPLTGNFSKILQSAIDSQYDHGQILHNIEHHMKCKMPKLWIIRSWTHKRVFEKTAHTLPLQARYGGVFSEFFGEKILLATGSAL